MTREEFQAKLGKLHPQFDCDLVAKLKADYISSLEAENAKLKDALESSARKLKELGSEYENCPPQHDCPSDLGLGCQQCWLDWLMGGEK